MRAKPGFTLLEAAVAMTIVALITIAAMGAFGADLRAADRARQLLPAAALAQERMAIIDLADASSLHMLTDSLSHGSFAPPYSAYAWTATTHDIMGDPGLVEMSVHVSWAEGAFDLTQRRYRPLPALTMSR